MTHQPQPRFDAVGIIVDDMARSLAFYRAMGFDLPAEADGEPHVEAQVPGGLRALTRQIQSEFAPSLASERWGQVAASQISRWR